MSEGKRRSHTEWCELIKEQEGREETILAFCRERGVSTQSFHYHKRRMREESQGGFREVALRGRSGVRLVREAGGWCVEVEAGFDARCLRAVVRVMG